MGPQPTIVDRVQECIKAGREERAKAAATKPEIKLKALGVDELGVITLVAATEGSPTLLDLDDEYVDKAGLTKMSFDFCSDPGRTFKANHQDPIDCKLVGNWVGAIYIDDGSTIRTLKADEKITPDTNVVAVGVKKSDARAAWFVEVKPANPELVELAKAGGIAGASWGAHVTKTEV